LIGSTGGALLAIGPGTPITHDINIVDFVTQPYVNRVSERFEKIMIIYIVCLCSLGFVCVVVGGSGGVWGLREKYIGSNSNLSELWLMVSG